ncbi:lipocalin family protein [Maritimibacter sp.]|uniref:lipocalin family protein n=1 Tax=Maritimibacter sp. TaxID=2003363 RepID=UPI001D82B2ED|nr:lipocalin family protein [Maritimibacter sp.]MBL6426492.1 lipocalin family protein [Maritimibacter sp.]
MRFTTALMALATTVAFAAPATAAKYRDTSVPMQTVNVNIDRYMGKWYEIARFPNWFENNCAGVTAEYTLQGDTFEVLNTCRQGTPDGPARSRKAEATPVGPGKVKVDFVQMIPGIGVGDYWVLYVAPDYSLAVVGEPSGSTGWVLSRTPQIRQSQLDTAYDVLRKNGYDTSKIQLVAQ